MLGVGDGTFGPRNDYLIFAGLDFDIGDMNRDGIDDIVTAVQDSIRVLFGTGSGTFTAGPGVSVAGGTTTQDVDLADLNRDGYLDVAVAKGVVKVIYGGAKAGTLERPSPSRPPSRPVRRSPRGTSTGTDSWTSSRTTASSTT